MWYLNPVQALFPRFPALTGILDHDVPAHNTTVSLFRLTKSLKAKLSLETVTSTSGSSQPKSNYGSTPTAQVPWSAGFFHENALLPEDSFAMVVSRYFFRVH